MFMADITANQRIS